MLIIKIPYFFGMMGGYVFDFISVLSAKKFSISSVRVQKFCATTQFDSDKVHSSFKAGVAPLQILRSLQSQNARCEKKNDGRQYNFWFLDQC